MTTELTQHPERLLDRLTDRMHALALAERFEEAAETRDRAAALAAILRRSHLFTRMQRAGRLVVEQPGRGGAEIVAGRLVNTWSTDGDVPLFSPTDIGAPGPEPTGPFGPVLDGSTADEIICVASWLDSNAADLRLLQVEGQWSSATISLPRFAAAKGVGTKRDT